MKKITATAATAAASLCAAAMAVSASAALTSDIFVDDGSGNYQFVIKDQEGNLKADIDYAEIASFDITFSWEDGDEVWAGGALVVQADAAWNSLGEWTKGEDANKPFPNAEPGKPIHATLSSPIPEDATFVSITVQNYGVDVTVDSLVIYAADGSVLYDSGSGAGGAGSTGGNDNTGDDTTTTTSDDTTAPDASDNGNTNTDTGNDKNNANTGVAGVAVAAGLAVLAAGGVAIARNRK